MDLLGQGDEDQALKLLSNQIRRTVILGLAQKDHQRFSDLMRACKLDPNSDTGLFLYHLHRLRQGGVVTGDKGYYTITQKGRDIAGRLRLLTHTNNNKDGLMEMKQDSYPPIDWQAHKTLLPRIEIEPVDEEFRLKPGSVIGGVGPGRLDLLDVLGIDDEGLPITRFPSEGSMLMRKYAMPEEELYAFALQRFTGVTRIGEEKCVESTRTFHDPDGAIMAKTIQWLARRDSGIYLKKQVSIDMHNNKPVSAQETEVLYTSLPVTDHPSKAVAQGTCRVQINGRRELALRLLSETNHDRKWEDYPTNTDLSIGKMYIPEETTRPRRRNQDWELAEIYIAQKLQ